MTPRRLLEAVERVKSLARSLERWLRARVPSPSRTSSTERSSGRGASVLGAVPVRKYSSRPSACPGRARSPLSGSMRTVSTLEGGSGKGRTSRSACARSMKSTQMGSARTAAGLSPSELAVVVASHPDSGHEVAREAQEPGISRTVRRPRLPDYRVLEEACSPRGSVRHDTPHHRGGEPRDRRVDPRIEGGLALVEKVAGAIPDARYEDRPAAEPAGREGGHAVGRLKRRHLGRPEREREVVGERRRDACALRERVRAFEPHEVEWTRTATTFRERARASRRESAPRYSPS